MSEVEKTPPGLVAKYIQERKSKNPDMPPYTPIDLDDFGRWKASYKEEPSDTLEKNVDAFYEAIARRSKEKS